MLNCDLIVKFYDCASIQRWNDHVRPVEFTELDKQSHKMTIAYVLGKFEEDENLNWVRLIEGGIFELLQRAILTDIKSPVFHQMMKRPEHKKEILKFVIDKLTNECFQGDKTNSFIKKIKLYFSDKEYAKKEKKILEAAHYLATNWEFKIISNVAPFIYGVDKTKEIIEREIEDHYDLKGVQRIMLGKKSYGFVDLCGQLRFQSRWAQSPRVPKTSVLGHMLMVASMAYLASQEIKACPKRTTNNFFGALFHDLPEILTRDIVSPVKHSVPGLPIWLAEYEQRQIEEKLLPLLPADWHDELRYYMVDEFSNKIKGGKLNNLLEIPDKFNENKYSPIDGRLIKACDDLAAFIEAVISMNHGIKSHYLEDGFKTIKGRYSKTPVVCKINFNKLVLEFEKRYPER
jgi:putative hydrolase of HD superfamily